MDMPVYSLGNRCVGNEYPAFIVAEIGINHNGDLDIALELIRKSYAVGADAVKFQMRNPDVCVPKDQWNKMRDTPWGYISYIEYKRHMEFGYSDYKAIDELCRELGMLWFASVWDTDSMNVYTWFKPGIIKIPSACITDHALLQTVYNYTLETDTVVILSTGMSTWEEIVQAVDTYDWKRLIILHCTSIYPCPEGKLNLNMIPELNGKWGHKYIIGYSGHEVGLAPSVAAVAMGANLVERHVTLDRAMWGTDQAASVEIQGLRRLIKDIRTVEKSLGDGIKEVYEEEKRAIEKLRVVK